MCQEVVAAVPKPQRKCEEIRDCRKYRTNIEALLKVGSRQDDWRFSLFFSLLETDKL